MSFNHHNISASMIEAAQRVIAEGAKVDQKPIQQEDEQLVGEADNSNSASLKQAQTKYTVHMKNVKEGLAALTKIVSKMSTVKNPKWDHVGSAENLADKISELNDSYSYVGHMKEDEQLDEGAAGRMLAGNSKASKEANDAGDSTMKYRGKDEKGVYTVTKKRAKGEKDYKEVGKRIYEDEQLNEGPEVDEKKREEIVLAMKQSIADFKKRYGKDWQEVMYATATKMAKEDEEVEGEQLDGDISESSSLAQRRASKGIAMRGSEAPGGDEGDDYAPRRSFVKKAGDKFTGKDGRKWVRYKKADGSLGVRPLKEEEQLDELSTTTLQKYAHKVEKTDRPNNPASDKRIDAYHRAKKILANRGNAPSN